MKDEELGIGNWATPIRFLPFPLLGGVLQYHLGFQGQKTPVSTQQPEAIWFRSVTGHTL